MTLSSPGAKQNPALDENSFQRLLAAAYIVQQHNEIPPRSESGLETSRILSQIAEIQSLIRAGNLDVVASCELVAARLREISDAHGVSVSLVTDGFLGSVGEAGMPVDIPGRCIASHSLLATEKLKAGLSFESSEAQSDMQVQAGLCQKLGIASLVAAPIERFGDLAGLIELRWTESRKFLEGDVRACRLMAGLVSSLLERSARLEARPVAEHNLAVRGQRGIQVADDVHVPGETSSQQSSAARADEGSSSVASADSSPAPIAPAGTEAKWESLEEGAQGESTAVCRVCGHPFQAEESFCGFCSLPRLAAEPSQEMQSKWASLWYLQKAKGSLQDAETAVPWHGPASERLAPTTSPPVQEDYDETLSLTPVIETPVGHTPQDLLLEPEKEKFLSRRRFRKVRVKLRDVVAIGIAVVMAYGIISAWPTSDSQLTWFQSLAIRFGLVHGSNQAPVFVGNPEARVWVDVHTSLYYCEGADLYGKTPEGEFMTQHDAQGSHFDPASQAPCP